MDRTATNDRADGAGRPSLPLSAALDDAATPGDVIDLLILEAFTSGREPFARTRELVNVGPDVVLLPLGVDTLRDAESDHNHNRLWSGEGWTARANRWKRGGTCTVTVTAVSAELAQAVMDAVVEAATDRTERPAERVAIGFWHLARHGPRRISRDVEAPVWTDVRDNYTRQVGAAVEPLIGLGPNGPAGRLLLLHGPPGTGKTTLLRSLALQWRDWCRVDYVLDPEQLFTNSEYLLDVALGEDDEDDQPDPRWRLLLLEDCDELVRAEAKAASGQQLSRLLNLTDGLLGQGRRVLIAITTNEDLAALHPAVTRPGRALAKIEIGRLPRTQAVDWLSRAGADPLTAARIGPDGATLAELFALLENRPVPAPHHPDGVGLYL